MTRPRTVYRIFHSYFRTKFVHKAELEHAKSNILNEGPGTKTSQEGEKLHNQKYFRVQENPNS